VSKHTVYGKQINEACSPGSCLQQAELYADYIGGDVYGNKTHAFVVKDNKIYDSMNMDYNGYSINNWQVKEAYGNKEEWNKI